MNAYFRACIILSLNYKVIITTRPYRTADNSRSCQNKVPLHFGGSEKRSKGSDLIKNVDQHL